MLRTVAALAIAALASAPLLVATPALAERPTARASGVQAVYSRPSLNARILDKLRNQERVYLTQCTRESRWCKVQQRDGGPSGWVMGSYLIGSGAKLLVTPFEFSFDPMDPLDFRGRGLFPFD